MAFFSSKILINKGDKSQNPKNYYYYFRHYNNTILTIKIKFIK